jgi:hypothetical protein
VVVAAAVAAWGLWVAAVFVEVLRSVEAAVEVRRKAELA